LKEQVEKSISSDQERKNAPLAVISLVLGFLSCVMFGFISGIPAVICGHISLSKLKREPNRYKGKRLATAGVVLGYIGILLTIMLALALLLIFFDREKLGHIL
jgi:hypothetical protein